MPVIELTKNNFDLEVIESNETVLIDFWAPWCGPCRMLTPIVDEIAREAGDSLKVCKVNTDEQPELARQFRVMSIPTLVVMKNGEQVARAVGVRPKQAILDMIENA